MPVVQPYRKSGQRLIVTCLQDLVLTATERDDPVNRRKQLQAFPPNFIHSLDASHMMLSALECNAIGLTFAAVHDSFWTHAADVDAMNGVLRDAFIRIHQEDVIGRLKSEFEARYRGSIYRTKVDSNTEVGLKIQEHRKEHRSSVKDELLQERKRQLLLQSIDPEEVRQGREMVTPASIFEELATPDMVTNNVDPEELGASELDVDADEEAGAMNEDIDTHADAENLSASDRAAAAKLEGIEKFGKQLQNLQGSNYFVAEMTRQARAPPKKTKTAQIPLWLPLTFPAIPKKGDFNVAMLKDSKYFFS
jgi:DNA-directed RNA polymerase